MVVKPEIQLVMVRTYHTRYVRRNGNKNQLFAMDRCRWVQKTEMAIQCNANSDDTDAKHNAYVRMNRLKVVDGPQSFRPPSDSAFRWVREKNTKRRLPCMCRYYSYDMCALYITAVLDF